jgi:hypothetical protein
VSLREQFPFLYEADCPQEYKTLYAQKKIALDNYVQAHGNLVLAFYSGGGNLLSTPKLNNNEVYDQAKIAIENFNENQLIYDEFNYYQDTGKILGVHPVFWELLKKREIVKMRESSAQKRLSNINRYINRGKRNLKKMTDAIKIAAQQKRLTEWEREKELLIEIKKLNE